MGQKHAELSAQRIAFQSLKPTPRLSTKNQGGLTHQLRKPLIKQASESCKLNIFILILRVKYCFSTIVFSTALHSRYLVFIYSYKLSLISYRQVVHLYSQLMMDVDHSKHGLQA